MEQFLLYMLLGVGTGLTSGQLVRVWRDEATGIVFQRGGWRYLIVLVALLLVRVLIRFLFNPLHKPGLGARISSLVSMVVFGFLAWTTYGFL